MLNNSPILFKEHVKYEDYLLQGLKKEKQKALLTLIV